MGWKITDKFLVDPQDSDSVPFDQGGIVRRSTWVKIKDYILGTATLTTSDKTVRGAINEVNTSLSDKAKQADLNTTNTNVSNHLADLITDSDGAHGFKVKTGTWTPVLKGLTVAGNNSYSQQTGRYVKHDKLITCFFRISISAKDANMAGDIHISGLPYSSYNVNANKPGINIGEIAYITLPTGCTQFTGELISGGNTIQLVANGGSYATTIKESNLAAYPTIIGSITYETTL